MYVRKNNAKQFQLRETPLAENNDDEEKYKLTCCLVALAQSYQNREIIEFGIDQMAECSTVDSWQMRLTLLKLMQRVLFRNLFLNQIHSNKIEEIVAVNASQICDVIRFS